MFYRKLSEDEALPSDSSTSKLGPTVSCFLNAHPNSKSQIQAASACINLQSTLQPTYVLSCATDA